MIMYWRGLKNELYGDYKKFAEIGKELEDAIEELRWHVRRKDLYGAIETTSVLMALIHTLLSEIASVLSPEAWSIFKNEVQTVVTELGTVSQMLSKGTVADPIMLKILEISTKLKLFLWYSLQDVLSGMTFDEAVLRRISLLSPKMIPRQPFVAPVR